MMKAHDIYWHRHRGPRPQPEKDAENRGGSSQGGPRKLSVFGVVYRVERVRDHHGYFTGELRARSSDGAIVGRSARTRSALIGEVKRAVKTSRGVPPDLIALDDPS